MNNKAHLRPKDYDSNGDIIPMACKEEKGDLISREALKKVLCEEYEAREHYIGEIMLKAIDNAPAVEIPCNQIIWEQGYECGKNEIPRFNRGELEKALNYWYEHLERHNEEQNEAAWCAINAIRYCIENSSAYQE